MNGNSIRWGSPKLIDNVNCVTNECGVSIFINFFMSFGKKYISLPKDVSYLRKFKRFAKTPNEKV